MHLQGSKVKIIRTSTSASGSGRKQHHATIYKTTTQHDAATSWPYASYIDCCASGWMKNTPLNALNCNW